MALSLRYGWVPCRLSTGRQYRFPVMTGQSEALNDRRYGLPRPITVDASSLYRSNISMIGRTTLAMRNTATGVATVPMTTLVKWSATRAVADWMIAVVR